MPSDPSEPRTRFDAALDDALRECIVATAAEAARRRLDGQAAGRLFFTKWFRDEDKFFFLFRKNARVTNMQFAELFALARTHIQTKDEFLSEEGPSLHRLQFFRRDEFNRLVRRVLRDVGALAPDTRSRRRKVADAVARRRRVPAHAVDEAVALLRPLLRRTIIFERNFGSAALFLPCFLQPDLAAICGEAGYVFSCGRLIYVRNIEKATPDELFGLVEDYLDGIDPSGKVLLTVFSHEDFVESDREYTAALRDGLDDVKIYLDKFYLGATPLALALNELANRERSRLVVTAPGNHREGYEQALRENPETDTGHTLFLITDHSAPVGPVGFRGDRQFLILYDQQFRNRNPFQIFGDENKPAWLAPVTIPHSLAAAMINITRPWRGADPLVVCDPFVGGGTTFLELLKFTHVEPECSDWNPLSPLVTDDNLQFVRLPLGALQTFRHDLSVIVEDPTLAFDVPDMPAEGSSVRALVDVLGWARALLPDYSDGSTQVQLNALRNKLEERDVVDRMWFYLLLKARARHLVGIRRGAKGWGTALAREARIFARQLDSFIDWRTRSEDHQHHVSHGREQRTILFDSRYSRACGIDVLNHVTLDKNEWTRDVRNLGGALKGAIDVVVADPPYGLNAHVDPISLAGLYRAAFRQMILCLRDPGQLVIALPDQSFSGRSTPSFTHKEACIRLILAIAEEEGRQAITLAEAYPTGSRSLAPPYYWESDRALRRAILHFQIGRQVKSANGANAGGV